VISGAKRQPTRSKVDRLEIVREALAKTNGDPKVASAYLRKKGHADKVPWIEHVIFINELEDVGLVVPSR